MLLLKGASANVADQHGSMPLHRAASKGNTTLVKLLLSYHANPNARDCTGNTPLLVTYVYSSLFVSNCESGWSPAVLYSCQFWYCNT